MILQFVHTLIIITTCIIYVSRLQSNECSQKPIILIPIPIIPLSTNETQEDDLSPQNKYIHSLPVNDYFTWLEKNPPKQLTKKERETILTIASQHKVSLYNAWTMFFKKKLATHKAYKSRLKKFSVKKTISKNTRLN